MWLQVIKVSAQEVHIHVLRCMETVHARTKARLERVTLYSCFFATNDIKINEQNKSIGIGSLYLQPELEAI